MELIPKKTRFLWNVIGKKRYNHGIFHKRAGGF